MSRYEEQQLERAKAAAPIVRRLRQKAGIIDDPPLNDVEVCSLHNIFEAWEALVTNDSIKNKQELIEHLVDVRDIGKDDL